MKALEQLWVVLSTGRIAIDARRSLKINYFFLVQTTTSFSGEYACERFTFDPIKNVTHSVHLKTTIPKSESPVSNRFRASFVRKIKEFIQRNVEAIRDVVDSKKYWLVWKIIKENFSSNDKRQKLEFVLKRQSSRKAKPHV